MGKKFVNFKKMLFICILVYFVLYAGISYSIPIQDFEDGKLSGWNVGGRQRGSNWWGVTEYAGSKMGYLHHRSFTELILSKSFNYSPGMVLSFDAEFTINGNTSPRPSGNSHFFNVVAYGINLLDSNGTVINYIGYLAATSYYPTNINTHFYVLRPNGIEHYVHDISDLASKLNVNINKVKKVGLFFWAYSSWWSNSDMIIRFDNIATRPINSSNHGTQAVPEPTTMFLMSIGLIGLAKVRRKK